MTTKTISLPEDIYEKLREERREDESFGDVIDRLLGRRELAEFWGAWDEETARTAREAIAAGRAASETRFDRFPPRD